MVSEVAFAAWRTKFEAMDSADLRELAASGRIKERKLELARLILHERDIADQSRLESEHLNLAREANSLAERAIEKAATANAIATLAIVIAAISAGVSFIVGFLPS